MKKNYFSAGDYSKKNPKKALLIKKAVKLGVKEYEETFRRLAVA